MIDARERRAARAVATTELRTRLRRLRGDARQLVGTVVSVVGFCVLVATVGAGPLVAFGRAVASGTPPPGDVGVATCATVAIGSYVGTSTAVNRGGVGVIGPLVRTSTTTRAVVIGRAGGELLGGATLALGPLVAVVGALVVGAGGPLAPLALLVGLVPVAVAAALVGRAVGAVGRLAVGRLGVAGWTRAAVGLAVVALVFLATQSVTRSLVDGSGRALPPAAVLPGTPAQAYGLTVLAPVGGRVDPVGVAAAAGLVAVGVVAAAVALRAEARLLVADDDGTGAAVVTRGVPAPFDRHPSTRVGWRYLVRTRRNPGTVSHLFPLAIGGLSLVGTLATNPSFALSVGPSAVVVLAGVLAGATYCLNPLGDDRERLPLHLTSARSTAVLLRGRAVAGATVGLALVALAAPVDAYANGLPDALARATVAVAVVACAPGVALGLGAAFPTFERREYMNVDRAHPSMLLLFGYAFGGTVVAAAGLALATWTAGGASAWVAVFWLVLAAALVGPATGGYVYAVRRFDGFDVDDV